jgi:drug/metabolite transporter (DMT)-like permease
MSATTLLSAPEAPPANRVRLVGLTFCLISATAFGVAAAFALEAEAAGVSLSTMLTGRFALAAIVFALVARVRRAAFPRGRVLLTCLGMGAIGYALQATLYFGALRQVDATLVGLLLYLYPALVVALAVVLRRERASRRVVAALGCSLGGLVLLLGGGVEGGGSSLGIAMALGAAVTYAVYITVAAGVLDGTDTFAMSAVICAATAVAIGAGGLVTGGHVRPTPAGLGWIAALALVATVVAVGTFFAGVRRIGASKAAVLSCFEPVVTAAVAVTWYAEALTPARVAGGAAVLLAVAVVETRGLRAPGRPVAVRSP